MEVVYDDEEYIITGEMKEAFSKYGCIVVRNVYSQDEIKQLKRNYEEGEEYHTQQFQEKDVVENHPIQTTVTWRSPGNDAFGMAARTQKLVETCSQLLGGEVYHYHSKLVLRQPNTGEDTAWYQDYGHWDNNHVLLPDLVTAFIAIDPAKKNKGCLQVLDMSHTAGRIDPAVLGDKVNAVKDQLQKVCPFRYVELEPGDVAFLHSAILHKRDANTDDIRRVTFQPVYNLMTNSPVKEGLNSGYTPLDVVYNDAVLDCENYTDLQGKQFVEVINAGSAS